MNTGFASYSGRPPRPYPGLRPFEAHEWSIFFGRERMIDEVIDRLARNRLVFIHGASGSGKSSLVRAGVLPKLARQYQRHGAPWITAAMRPSGGPLWNLATEFARLEGSPDDIDRIGAIVGRLNARGATLACVAAELKGFEGKSICLLVDQFEEVFRFERESSREEAELFVELISRAVDGSASEADDALPVAAPGLADPVDVHVVVTMRSEFLGDCARFAGLAETINRTQYLVPRLDDGGLLHAVCRPAQIYGGTIAPALADRLIGSVRGREDELPLLQHGLMLIWDEAVARTVPGSRIVLDGGIVDAAGGLARLLSAHADRVMAGVAPDETARRIVEALFRELTDVNAEGSAIRRPRSFKQLCAVADAPPDTVRPIVEAFRAPEVSFLTPYPPKGIGEDTIIDISHEALIRCWQKIAAPEAGWLRQEFDDGLAWRSLLIEARAFAIDKTRILSPAMTEGRGSLVEARNKIWSDRYGGGWAEVEGLLVASRKAATGARRRRQLAFAALALMVAGLGVSTWMALTQTARLEQQAVLLQQQATRLQTQTHQLEEEQQRLTIEAQKANQAHDVVTTMFSYDFDVDRTNRVASLKTPLSERLLPAAETGNPFAQYMLGVFYAQGLGGVKTDYHKAYDLLNKAAAAGEPAAMTAIGDMHYFGQGMPVDYTKARDWYEKAAALSNPSALSNLGYLYLDGTGFSKDYTKAREWFEKAAAVGDASAKNGLGTIYNDGLGVTPDYAKALDWYSQSASAGDPRAINNMGLLYDQGHGVQQNYDKARDYYEKAAAAGVPVALSNLGSFYEQGHGVQQNYDKARDYYERAAAAGNELGMNHLGLLYLDGPGGQQQDYAKARAYFERAAAAGSLDALTNLGYLYESGYGVQKSYDKAREYYERAAAAGNAQGMYNLGSLYLSDRGDQRQDYTKARAYFERAAAAGNVGALTNLGYLYEHGYGVQQSYEKAREYYERAAAAGSAQGMNNLGLFYEWGRGVQQQDYAMARSYYEKAAAAGNAQGMYSLGSLYLTGRGVQQKDYSKARAYFEQAAAAGNVDALTNLGEMYAQGYGVPQDYTKALDWFSKAAGAIEEDETRSLGKPGLRTAQALNTIGWYELFNRDFTTAQFVLNRAYSLAPDNLYIVCNRAHVLMFLGLIDEARAIYLSHANDVIASSGKSWKQAVLEDFAEFGKAGLSNRLIDAITADFSASVPASDSSPSPH